MSYSKQGHIRNTHQPTEAVQPMQQFTHYKTFSSFLADVDRDEAVHGNTSGVVVEKITRRVIGKWHAHNDASVTVNWKSIKETV
jgi:predicted secreted Zn-dependent protease